MKFLPFRTKTVYCCSRQKVLNYFFATSSFTKWSPVPVPSAEVIASFWVRSDLIEKVLSYFFAKPIGRAVLAAAKKSECVGSTASQRLEKPLITRSSPGPEKSDLDVPQLWLSFFSQDCEKLSFDFCSGIKFLVLQKQGNNQQPDADYLSFDKRFFFFKNVNLCWFLTFVTDTGSVFLTKIPAVLVRTQQNLLVPRSDPFF